MAYGSRAPLAILCLGCILAGTPGAQEFATDVEARIREGVQQFERGELEAARTTFESVLAEQPDHVVAIYELAFTHVRLGEVERGLDIIDDAIARELAVTPEFYSLSASILDTSGRQQESVQRFEQGVAAFPDNHNLRLNFGITQLRVGDSAAARASFERAIVLLPRHPSAHFFLGQIYANEGQHAAAILALGTGIGFDSQPPRMAVSANMIKTLMDGTIQRMEDGTPIAVVPIDFNVPPMTIDKFSSGLPMQVATGIAMQRKSEGELSYEPYAISYGLIVTAFVQAGIDPASHFVADHYFRFYEPMSANGHADTFAHIVMASVNPAAAREWLQANTDKLEAFATWSRSQ